MEGANSSPADADRISPNAEIETANPDCSNNASAVQGANETDSRANDFLEEMLKSPEQISLSVAKEPADGSNPDSPSRSMLC